MSDSWSRVQLDPRSGLPVRCGTFLVVRVGCRAWCLLGLERWLVGGGVCDGRWWGGWVFAADVVEVVFAVVGVAVAESGGVEPDP